MQSHDSIDFSRVVFFKNVFSKEREAESERERERERESETLVFVTFNFLISQDFTLSFIEISQKI